MRGDSFARSVRRRRRVLSHRRFWGWARMGDLARFRDGVRTYRRAVGRSQQQLATVVGVHPDVLSHKLNGHGRAVLTTPEAIRIVTTLAGWGALETRSAAEDLLAAAGVPAHAIPDSAWTTAPLSALPAETPGTATASAT